MERIQILLLLVISSSWLLMCENEKEDSVNKQISFHQLPQSTTAIAGENDKGFYTDWLLLSFAGSGTNWMASVPLISFPEEVMQDAKLDVFMKKYGTVLKLDYNNGDSIIEYGVDHGFITISSNFNPVGIEFSYRVVPDGTYVNNKFSKTSYATVFR